MNGSPNEQPWTPIVKDKQLSTPPLPPSLLSHPTCNIKPTEISKIQIQNKNVHRTPNADICNMHTPTENKNLYNSGTKDKKRKARRILVFWFACDGSNTFVLCDSGEIFLPAGLWEWHRCPQTDLWYVWRMCIRTVCGEGVVLVCTYGWGGSAPFGCNGGPWHLMGLQQCGGQAGTVSQFGYVHIRSRSMAPPGECHFLRSNTQTWRNRKEQTVKTHGYFLCHKSFSFYHVMPLTGTGSSIQVSFEVLSASHV